MTEDTVRVIVVDDMPDAAQTLAMLLELDGYCVSLAYDGQQALELAGSWAPHCVLFDIEMPGIDGFDLCKRIRALDSDIVLIAVTAHPSQDARVAGAFAVADHYFSKPVDPALLRKLLPPLRV